MAAKLTGAAPVVLVTSAELGQAWAWLKQTVSVRPPCAPKATHLRDDKKFNCSAPPGPLQLATNAPECVSFAQLYLASLIAPTKSINEMAAGKQAPEVRTFTPLDAQISGVLKKPTRFRAGFAEHLSFWICLADASVNAAARFAMARPNTQPEDKGHDGLLFDVGQQSAQAELQSVKNSIAKAKALVSTAKFRKHGVATAGAQLDDFWLVQNSNIGFVRLEQMLSEVTTSLGLTPDAIARQAMLAQCAFNAVVVADAAQGTNDLFDGYEHVQQTAPGRVATFVGAKTWKATAAAVQHATLAILAAKGLG